MNAEIVGFVQLYGAQLSRVLSWRVGDPLPIPMLQEMDAVVTFFHSIATSTVARAETDQSANDILRAYSEKALFLLQHLNSAVSYPNQLAGSLEPMTTVERTLMQNEFALGRLESSIEFLDKGTHPILAGVVQKLLIQSSTILTTMAIISGGDKMLSRVESTSSIALISPSSKVNPDEAATMGTLIELGNWAVRVLVHLLKVSTAPAACASTTSSLPQSLAPFQRKRTIEAARHVIETLMVYAATQLSRWLDQDRLDGSLQASSVLDSQRGGKRGRASMPLMNSSVQSAVQDQARDLNLLAARAKEVLGKLSEDDGGSALILLEVLVGFASAKLLKSSGR